VRGAALPAGAQLPVPVRVLVGVRARFWFEAPEWGTQKAAFGDRGSGMAQVRLRALGLQFSGLGTLKVGR
jgi:hypothetical protein